MTLDELKQDLNTTEFVTWEHLPDLDLYLDQVVTYLSRDQVKGCPEGELTPSMVNNYVKEGLLPRAVGKKYNREHLVFLKMINALKQVYNVKEIKDLLAQFALGKEPATMYQEYLDDLELAINRMEGDLVEGEIVDLAMQLAVQSYVYKLVSKRLLEKINQIDK